MTFTNCISVGNTTETIEAYLQHLQDKTNITMIPAVTMLCLFAITGLAGNSLVFIVYSKKQAINPTKILIIAIASFDLIANVCAIPMAIYTMLDTWDFQHALLCKVTVSMGSFTALGGAISLLIVAFIRYRKVCAPYEWQVTVKEAIISSVVTFVLAIVVSAPYFVIYGVKTRQTPCPNIQGSECFADNKSFNTIWPLVNNAFFVILYLFLSVSLVVLYILVGKAARGHSKRLEFSANKTRALNSKLPSNTAANKEPLICCGLQSTNTSVSSATKVESTHRGRTKGLFCCNHSEEQDSQDDTQSSMNLRTLSTTSEEHVKTNQLTVQEVVITESSMSEAMINSYISSYPLQRSLSVPNESADYWSKTDTTDKMMYVHNKARSLNNDKQLFNSSLDDNASKTQQGHSKQRKEVRVHDFTSQNIALSKEHKREPLRAAKRQRTSRHMSRITIMLIIISTIYVLGFLPFLILTIFKKVLSDEYSNMNMIEQAFYNLFYRLYFLNSAANPIIYSMCDRNFRRACIKLVTCRNRK